MSSLLDPGQIIKLAADETYGAIKVNVVATAASAGSVVNIGDGTGGGAKAAVTASNALVVDGSASVQPVTATALPLPTGASTSALQTQISAQLPAALGANVTAASLAVNVASDQVLPVSASSLPLPTGASTAAKQPALGTAGTASSDVLSVQGVSGMTALIVDGSGSTQPVSGTVTANIGTTNGLALDSSIATLSAQLPSTLGAHTTATSLSVNVASDQTLPISAASLPLPTGAATAVKQPALGVSGTPSADVLTVQGAVGMKPLLIDGSGTTQPVSGSVSVTQATGTNLHTVVDSGTLTANIGTTNGLALDTSISTLSSKFTVGQTLSAAAVSVVLPSDQTLQTASASFSAGGFVRKDYTVTTVTTSAYTTLIASTSSKSQELEIFDSSGQTLKLAVGAAGSEVDQILIFPGGNGRVKLSIPASSRLSIKAVSANADVGELNLNIYV